MVEFADFHVLIATLAPAFLLAGLVAHYRLGVSAKRRDVITPRLAWVLLGLNLVTTLFLIFQSLAVLGGFLESFAALRLQYMVMLGFLTAFTLAVVLWDARQGRR